MATLKCPKCADPIKLDGLSEGGVAACPGCGQKFRVPGDGAKRTSSAGGESKTKPRTADSEENDSPQRAAKKSRDAGGLEPRSGTGRPPPKPSTANDDLEDDEDEETDEPVAARRREKLRRVKESSDGEVDDLGEEESRDDEDRPVKPKKRKKKKKKAKAEGSGLRGLHIALIVGGVFVVLAATGLFFMIQRGVFAKKKIDPAELLAQLEKSGVLIERDTRSPDQPVTSLNFFGGDIPPGVLDQLGVFPQLQKLIFGGTKMSDVQLEHLEDLTSLRVLNLSNTKVTGGGMQFLKKLVNLEELNVNQTLVTDAGLNQLKGLTKLKRLIVTGSLAKGLELEAAIPGLKVTRD